jgi:hypothetical protein
MIARVIALFEAFTAADLEMARPAFLGSFEILFGPLCYAVELNHSGQCKGKLSRCVDVGPIADSSPRLLLLLFPERIEVKVPAADAATAGDKSYGSQQQHGHESARESAHRNPPFAP